MTHAYSELYVEDSRRNLANMLDYAVNDCGYDADEFFDMFIECGIAKWFGMGSPKFVVGMSGIELAREIVYQTTGERIEIPQSRNFGERSVEYWAGWAIAQYQWYSGKSFKDIVDGGLTISRICSMYILHEADITKFYQVADDILDEKRNKESKEEERD